MHCATREQPRVSNTDFTTDTHRLYSLSACDRPIEAGSHRRDVQQTATGSGAIDQANCPCTKRCTSATRCRRGHGVDTYVHGHARCTKDWRSHNHKLHVRCHAPARKDTRGVPELAREEMRNWSRLRELRTDILFGYNMATEFNIVSTHHQWAVWVASASYFQHCQRARAFDM